jgi:hypothetical protein
MDIIITHDTTIDEDAAFLLVDVLEHNMDAVMTGQPRARTHMDQIALVISQTL